MLHHNQYLVVIVSVFRIMWGRLTFSSTMLNILQSMYDQASSRVTLNSFQETDSQTQQCWGVLDLIHWEYTGWELWLQQLYMVMLRSQWRGQLSRYTWQFFYPNLHNVWLQLIQSRFVCLVHFACFSNCTLVRLHEKSSTGQLSVQRTYELSPMVVLVQCSTQEFSFQT